VESRLHLDIDELSAGLDAGLGGCGWDASKVAAGLDEALRIGRIGSGIDPVRPGLWMRRVDMLLCIVDIGAVPANEAVHINRLRVIGAANRHVPCPWFSGHYAAAIDEVTRSGEKFRQSWLPISQTDLRLAFGAQLLRIELPEGRKREQNDAGGPDAPHTAFSFAHCRGDADC
jgi:hypothetical protein